MFRAEGGRQVLAALDPGRAAPSTATESSPDAFADAEATADFGRCLVVTVWAPLGAEAEAGRLRELRASSMDCSGLRQ
jgi:hypothetical protein